MKETKLLHIISYFHKVLGYQFYVYLLYNFIVALLDVFGIAMFIPLIGFTLGLDNRLNALKFIPEFYDRIGFGINLYSVLVIIFGIFSIKGLTVYLSDKYATKLRVEVVKNIRYDLVDKIQSMSYRGYTLSDPGKIQFTMVGESMRYVQTIRFFVSFFQNFVMLVTYIILALYTNWSFALLVIAGGLLSNFIYKYFNKIISSKGRKISTSGRVFNNYMIQSIQYFKYLKVTNSYDLFNKKLKKSIKDYEEKQYDIGNINAVTHGMREPLIILIIALVLIVYLKIIEASPQGILISLLIFYRALTYLMNTQDIWSKLQGTYPSIFAIDELKDELDSHREGEQKDTLLSVQNITLENTSVNFDNTSILRDISMCIDHKESIALVGESGAGKTTLANLISGLITPNNGVLKLNGKNIENTHLNAYRTRIGYVTQEPVIFNDTLYNNVTMWDEKTEDNLRRFNDCIASVNLMEFFTNLDMKEDAPLGSNGILISGGQKQRISIARELYRDIDLLILDEATSALDTETENIIKSNIEKLKGKYMMVIVAHRLSTIKSVDKIYLLDKGKIIDCDTYQELYNRSSKFKKMVDLQEL